ncbi:MAG: type II 3-dehydroquinate dehydratase [Rhodobacteraceae bacterium]|nr:type II 3-dehydroquinate dehydratase [Paracoccaceae bacterium]MCY4138812.1 type II 3-dehydroquinate dehydratase [Paracoccaceae bacterium]
MKSILILNGPNMNILGIRDPGLYGTGSLEDLEAKCIEYGKRRGVRVECRQSNHEGTLIDWIHDAMGNFDGIVLNAGGYTHTSIALMDAVSGTGTPTIEVHLTDVQAREEFRRVSFIARVATGVISGHGAESYTKAIDLLINGETNALDRPAV